MRRGRRLVDTSPSLAVLSQGGYEIAAHGSNGDLWLYGSAGTLDTGLAMAPATSPSIAGLAGGGYEAAFQAKPVPAPAAGTPVTTTVPAPAPTTQGGKPRLRVQLVVRWSYGVTHTQVVRARLTRHPHDMQMQIRCRGRGCPKLRPRSGRARTLARVLSALRGKRYRVDDRIMIILSSTRYAAEHMQITIRRNKLPAWKSY